MDCNVLVSPGRLCTCRDFRPGLARRSRCNDCGHSRADHEPRSRPARYLGDTTNAHLAVMVVSHEGLGAAPTFRLRSNSHRRFDFDETGTLTTAVPYFGPGRVSVELVAGTRWRRPAPLPLTMGDFVRDLGKTVEWRPRRGARVVLALAASADNVSFANQDEPLLALSLARHGLDLPHLQFGALEHADSGRTALGVALEAGQAAWVERHLALLRRCARADDVLLAMRRGLPATAARLVAPALVSHELIFLACELGHVDVLQAALATDEGAALVHGLDARGRSALLVAAAHAHAHAAYTLLDMGVAPGTADEDGCTALLHAAEHGMAPLVRRLVALGVPQVPDAAGRTPRSVAADAEVQALLPAAAAVSPPPPPAAAAVEEEEDHDDQYLYTPEPADDGSASAGRWRWQDMHGAWHTVESAEAAPPQAPAQPLDEALSWDDVAAAAEAITGEVAAALGVSAAAAEALLLDHDWDAHRALLAGPPPATAAATPTEPGTCATCYDTESEVSHLGCGHGLCADCWQTHLRVQLNEGRHLAAACPLCPRRAASADWAALAEPAVAQRRQRLVLRRFVDAQPEMGCCRGEGCEAVARARPGGEPDVVCALCSAEFCVACGEAAHRGLECAAWARWQRDVTANLDLESVKYMLANFKRCPRCQEMVQKNGGCRHMTCRCGHQYCHLCQGDWPCRDCTGAEVRPLEWNRVAGDDLEGAALAAMSANPALAADASDLFGSAWHRCGRLSAREADAEARLSLSATDPVRRDALEHVAAACKALRMATVGSYVASPASAASADGQPPHVAELDRHAKRLAALVHPSIQRVDEQAVRAERVVLSALVA